MAYAVKTVTTGGKGLAQLRRRLGRNYPKFAKNVRNRVAREMLPEIKGRTPKRSGKLAKGYRLRARRDGVELRNTQFYALAARFPSSPSE